MRVEIVPATPDDVREVIGRTPEYRVRALAGRAEGKTLAVGGVAFLQDGPAAFVAMKPGARKYPVAIHRAGKAAIKLFREIGLKRVVAMKEDGVEPAERWLRRLGFEAVEVNGIQAFIWRDN